MKKLLLTLLLLFSFGFATTAQEQELELFDVTPDNTFSTTGTASTTPTTLTINGYDFTVCNVWWQKSKNNSYMAFKKGGDPAGYMILPKLEGKKITKISMSLPTGVSVKNTKFDIYANETKIGNTVTFTNANEYVAFEVPEANQDENTEFKIVSANTANQIGFGKLKVHYVDASAAVKPSVAYTTSPKEYVLNEGATADNKVDYGTKVTFTAKNFAGTPAIEVFHDESAAFDAEGTYTITIEEETYVEIKDGETVIAHYNFTPVAAKAEITANFDGENHAAGTYTVKGGTKVTFTVTAFKEITAMDGNADEITFGADGTYTTTITDDCEFHIEATNMTGERTEAEYIFTAEYPTAAPAAKISLTTEQTEVYPGYVVTVDANGAERLAWTVNGTAIEGTSYTVAEEIGTELKFVVYTYVTGKEGEIENSITRTVTVAEKREATFQFSGENGSSYGLTPQTNSSLFEVDVENPVSELTEGIVKINLAGEKYRYWNNDKTLRVQNTSSLTISVPETHYITEIIFEGTNTTLSSNVGPNCGTFANGKWSAGDLTVSSVKFEPAKTMQIKSITIKYAERPVPATEIVGLSYKLTGKSQAIVVDYTIHIKNHKDTDTYKLMLSVDGGEPIEITPEGTPALRAEGTPEAAPARVATGANASFEHPAEGATHDLAGTYTATIDEDKAAKHTVSLAVHLNDAETADHTADAVTIGTTTGIENVTVDAAEAAEYYTLQGIRVAEPQAGQVYIVRRGATATKELVK